MQEQETKPKTIDEVYSIVRDEREKYVKEELLPEYPSLSPTSMEIYWLVWGDIKHTLEGVRGIIRDRIKELNGKIEETMKASPDAASQIKIRIIELERLFGNNDNGEL